MVPGTIDIYKFGWRKKDKRNEREIGQACKSSTSVGIAGEIRALGQTKADFMVSRCMSSKFLQNQQLEYVIRYLQEGDTTLIEIRIHFAVKSLCRRTPSIHPWFLVVGGQQLWFLELWSEFYLFKV